MGKRNPELRTPEHASARPVHAKPSRPGALPQNSGKHDEAHLCLSMGKEQRATASPMILGRGTDPPLPSKDAGAESRVTAS
jgi:hypothetical protein